MVIYPTAIVVTGRLAAIVKPLIDRKYVAMSARKKTTDYKNI